MHVSEVLDVVFRWAHLIAGIMWIGNSMLFNWLDRNLVPPPKDDAHKLSQGTIHMVHSGAFYEVEKKLLGPGEVPDQLHWFKWQNGITWMTGISLLVIVYFMNGAAFLVDPSVRALSPGVAIAISLGSLVVGWAVYHGLWAALGERAPNLTSALLVALLFAAAYGFTLVFSGRAAYIETGVLIGTMMTGNVWMVILPSQRELIAATKAGRAQDKALSLRAKQRSIHNNYLTFPLLFIMLSNHFPSTYGSHLNWLILFAVMVGGAGVRHFMNTRYSGGPWLVPAIAIGGVALATMVALTHLSTPPAFDVKGEVGFARAQEIMVQRCVPCHSVKPADAMFPVAPANVMFDTAERIQAMAPRIKDRAVVNKTMPFLNRTGITEEERAELGKWIDSGAKLEMIERVVRSRRVITPEGEVAAAIHVAEGRIARVAEWSDVPMGAALDDWSDVPVLPGVVDTHVHLNEPGRTEWEGFASATLAAAIGGTTSLVDMPLNSIPPTTTRQGLAAKRAAARGQCAVDVGFWGGVVPGNAGELGGLVADGVRGFKCFLIDSGVEEFGWVGEADLAPAMRLLAGLGVPLLVHAEVAGPIDAVAASIATSDPRLYATYLASRPPAAEEEAIALVARLCADTRARTHIVHHSAATALPLIARARAAGLPLTAETCPHYLHFAAERIPDGATPFKCAPPIRDEKNREALWRALAEGTLDLVASDHSPCTPGLKALDAGDFVRAWGGVAGLQVALPATWTEARRRGHSLMDVARWMSAAPARLAGLAQKGAIAAGRDADLIAFDADAPLDVAPAWIRHRHKVTPYANERLAGVVLATYLRGTRIVDNGRPLATDRGELL